MSPPFAAETPDAALRHLEQAVTLAERADLRPELALAHLQLGLLRRHLGQEARAVESITRGQRLASELGMDHLARAVLERGLPTTSASPSLLSARQLDVLRLVAQGRTNREIAEALVLTEGTVANHLTAVFPELAPTIARRQSRTPCVMGWHEVPHGCRGTGGESPDGKS